MRPAGAATINLRLAAVRRMADEAADTGLLSPDLAAAIRRVQGARRIGVRVGNWMSAQEGLRLLATCDPGTLRDIRNRAMLALLIGCGLRRGEVLALRREAVQRRDDHWMIADLRARVVTSARSRCRPGSRRAFATASCFRAIARSGVVCGEGMTPKVIWDVVRVAARHAGLTPLARTTCGARVPACVTSPAAHSSRLMFAAEVSFGRLDVSLLKSLSAVAQTDRCQADGWRSSKCS